MVEPLNPIVHCGGSVSFRTSFDGRADTSRRGSKSVWSAEDSSLVKIDSKTGAAKVSSETGATTVFYKGPVYAFTQVRVEKVARIELDDNNGANPLVVYGLLNKNEAESVSNNKLHLAFFTKSGEKFTRPMSSGNNNNNRGAQIKHNFHVKCSVAERAWATATAFMDSVTGEMYCNVVPARNLPISSPFAPDALTLKVSVSDISESYSVEQVFPVKFVSRFAVVLDRSHSAPLRNIILTPQQTHKTVSVLFGSPSLAVAPVNSDLLSVTVIAPGVYDIDVQPSATSSAFSTSVEFRDTSTGQFENLTVIYRTYYEPEKQQRTEEQNTKQYGGESGRSPVVYYLLILSVLLIIVSAIVMHYCSGDDIPRITPTSTMTPALSMGLSQQQQRRYGGSVPPYN